MTKVWQIFSTIVCAEIIRIILEVFYIDCFSIFSFTYFEIARLDQIKSFIVPKLETIKKFYLKCGLRVKLDIKK